MNDTKKRERREFEIGNTLQARHLSIFGRVPVASEQVPVASDRVPVASERVLMAHQQILNGSVSALRQGGSSNGQVSMAARPPCRKVGWVLYSAAVVWFNMKVLLTGVRK